MALFLAEGGESNRLLGLSCRHVLFEPEYANIDYVHDSSKRPKEVILLGREGMSNFIESIVQKIGRHGIMIKLWKKWIEELKEREKGTNADDVAEAKISRVETQKLVDKAEEDLDALLVLNRDRCDWMRQEVVSER